MPRELTKISLLLIALLLLPAAPLLAQEKPAISQTDRVRLAEAFRIGELLGERLWTGWNQAPFAVLLVTPENEFLIRHPKPSSDFILLGNDKLLKSDVYYRKRTQATNLLATFPVVGPVPTIVVGQAENTTRKTSTPWVVTVLHEHFHQLQYSQPTYYADVNALDLARGDQTGMWMLNYPFPYDWMEMKEHFMHLSHLQLAALQAKRESDFRLKLAAYLKQRHELEQTLSPDDYRYFSFQLWQEGIARYTEYRIAQIAAQSYRPTKAMRRLDDYTPFIEVARNLEQGILDELNNNELAALKRVKYYALGAGEGLLLDRANPGWRNRYLADKFYLNKYFVQVK
jgi:hypothetical protein